MILEHLVNFLLVYMINLIFYEFYTLLNQRIWCDFEVLTGSDLTASDKESELLELSSLFFIINKGHILICDLLIAN